MNQFTKHGIIFRMNKPNQRHSIICDKLVYTIKNEKIGNERYKCRPAANEFKQSAGIN